MLTEILSSDKIKLQGSEKPLKSSHEIAEESSQFSKILSSLDKGVKQDSSSEVLKNIEAMFEDDKEFLKESLSFLNSEDNDSKLLNSETKIGEVATSEVKNSLFGLNFGNYKTSAKTVDSSEDEQNFKVLINSAKDFLKSELMKKSISEKDMPQTLRGLTQLAESKGITLKDVKFNLEEKLVDNQKKDNMIINQHSTEALLRGKNRGFVALKVGNTDRTPENLTPKNSLSNSDGKTEVKKFDLASLLSNSEVSKESKTESSLNLSKGIKGLGDILKSENSLELLNKNKDNVKNSSKNLGMADKIGKSLNMSSEFVSSLFSEDDMNDLGIDTKKVSGLNESENIEHNLLRESEKLKGSLELKIGEAKTMSRHLASNIQEQIDNYKNPFQKMSLTLNPQKLGEVEIDIIKRGNSVKITLSGNSQTVNILSANSLELRNQLINIGLEDPTFKFNEDGRNGSQQREQQQKDKDENDEVVILDDEQVESFEIESLLI